MAPSHETIEQTLRDAVFDIFKNDPDSLTVNKARQHVVDKLGLDSTYFKDTAEWKDRSKDLIKELADKLMSGEMEPPSPEKAKKETKNGAKRRSSSEEPSPAPKRQKKAANTKKPAPKAKKPAPKKPAPKKEESESELSELSDVSDEPKKRKTTKKAAAKKEESDSELSDLGSSPEEEPPKKKPAAKRASVGRKAKKEESDSELSELDDSEEEKPKKKTKAAPRRKSKKLVESEDEDEASDEEGSLPDGKTKRATPAKKQNAKRPKVKSESEDEPVDKKEPAEEEGSPKKANKVSLNLENKPNKDGESKQEDSEDEKKPVAKDEDSSKPAAADDSDSDLSSVVIDEPPPKRGRKSKGDKGSSKPRPAAAAKPAKEMSADEAEIKKLQGHLVKCGVRKIWGFELKQYGDDTRAKIRHLRGMLKDIGMTGRFSEARAKEIKEERELLADLEAVNEMNNLWGSGNGRGRTSRGRSVKKPTKEESDDEDDDGNDAKDEGDEDEANGKAKSRVSKRMADLAFLGDESESD